MPLFEKTLQDIAYQEWHNGTVTPETPVVLVLHWMGGDFTAMQFLFAEYSQPVRAVFLQAPYYGGDKFGGWSWYPDEEPFYDRPEAEQAPDIRAATDRVAGFLQALRGLYPAKVAVTGMSQGGDLSLALAAYTPELVDLAIPFAGRLSSVMRPASPKQDVALPTISMHTGADDPIVSVASAREAAAWLKAAGYNAELHEYPGVGHTISGDMVKQAQSLLAAL